MPRAALVRALPVLLLVAAPLVLLLPTLAGGRALLGVHSDQLSPWRAELPAADAAALDAASQPLAADKTLMFQPQFELAAARLANGEAPLWNPDSLCGVPLLAQAVHGVLHPPNLLALVLPPARAWSWIAWLQTTLAALFTFALARALGLAPWAACLAGLAFAFSGFLAARLQWFQIQGASIYLPLALLGVERAFAGARHAGTAILALAVGLSLLAGFPQSSVLALYAAGLSAAAHVLAAWHGGGEARRLGLRSGLHVGAGLLLGLLIGMPQFGPAAELAASSDSTRRAVAPELAATLALRPAELALAVVPDLFGHPADLRAHALPQLRHAGVVQRLYAKPNANYVETASTFGLAPLLLALLGLLSGRRGVALGAALMAGGALLAVDAPWLPAVLHLPALSSFDPRRFLLLFELGGALLAGLGLARVLESGPPRWYVASVAVVALLLVVAALVALGTDEASWAAAVVPPLAAQSGLPEAEVAAHSADLALDLGLLQAALVRTALLALATAGALVLACRRAGLGVAVLVLLTAVDGLAYTARANATLPAEGHGRPPPGLAQLTDDDGGRLVRFVAGDPRDVLAYPLPPDTGLPFGVRDLSGYITLAPRRVEALHELLEPGTTYGVGTAALHDPASLDSPLLDLFAVTRVLSDVPLERAGLRPLGRVGDAWLYANESALPRVRLAPAVLVVPDEAAARAALLEPGVDPRSRVVVEGGLGAFGVGAGTVAVASDPGTARLVHDAPEHVVVEVEAARDGLLVLADSWMPGWTATLDGAPAPLAPADLAFRAVAVPAGRHVVSFTYASRLWDLGRFAGLAGLLGLAASVALARRAGRTRRAG
jgi:hypothetical protein